ncbi:MAG: ribonuclease HII [Lentisphaeria bacterium]|nr:ribonuclease HII [Lentisphaeria bacterium]
MARQFAVLRQDDQLLLSERQLRAEGFSWIAGVDEAGRGPLAGSVVAAAVVLPVDRPELPGVFDSKQLSEKEREELFDALYALPGIRISVASASPEEIDRLNILRATHLAMRRAVSGIKEADFVLVDGLPVQFTLPSRNIVKGDAKCASIAAASIIAKVTRDREMVELDRIYPEYGFAKHKGYGTAEHLEALKKFGPLPVHRKSFRPVYELLPDSPVQGTLDF